MDDIQAALKTLRENKVKKEAQRTKAIAAFNALKKKYEDMIAKLGKDVQACEAALTYLAGESLPAAGAFITL